MKRGRKQTFNKHQNQQPQSQYNPQTVATIRQWQKSAPKANDCELFELGDSNQLGLGDGKEPLSKRPRLG